MCRSACNQVFNHGGALRPAGILPSLHSTNLISRSHLHTSCSKGYLKKPLENYHESLIKYKVRFVPTIDNRLLQGKLSRALQHDFLQKHKPPPKVVCIDVDTSHYNLYNVQSSSKIVVMS